METRMLLCELHAHTSWSDGELTATELVDLYGMHGFDVLCVTDHLLPGHDRSYRLRRETYAHYVKTIDREARRAREQYDLLLIPGAELTHPSGDPDEAGHALAVGLRNLCSVDDGLEPALRAARDAGAAIVAAHPHDDTDDLRAGRTTRWFWKNWRRLDGLVDRYEVFTAGRRSGGSPRWAWRPSPQATSIASSSCRAGRRGCRARRVSARWSATYARTAARMSFRGAFRPRSPPRPVYRSVTTRSPSWHPFGGTRP